MNDQEPVIIGVWNDDVLIFRGHRFRTLTFVRAEVEGRDPPADDDVRPDFVVGE